MMQQSLLPLPSEQMNKLALECFASILKYMGDYTENNHAKDKKHKNNNSDSPPPAPLLTEVEAVYTLLRVKITPKNTNVECSQTLTPYIIISELPLGHDQPTH